MDILISGGVTVFGSLLKETKSNVWSFLFNTCIRKSDVCFYLFEVLRTYKCTNHTHTSAAKFSCWPFLALPNPVPGFIWAM